jgi:3-oxoacyl-[acyl-carrier-protein] synthase-1
MEVNDSAGEPVRASPLTVLPTGASRAERMTALALTAADDPALRAGLAAKPPVSLLLALPDDADFDAQAFVVLLKRRAGFERVELLRDGVVAAGRAAFFTALGRAGAVLGQGHDLVLVAGIDSLCDRGSLQRLAARRRTLGRDNPDGLVPGEGAAFALVGRPRAGAPRPATVLACATAQENSPPLSADASRAEGLTAAFRQLRADPLAGARRVDHLFCAQTGESLWARELAYAYQRNTTLMPEPFTFQVAGALFGDAGAAAPALQACLALPRLAAAASQRALLYACSDGGAVGACIVEGPPEARA